METPSSPSSTITAPPDYHETALMLAKLATEAMTCHFALLHHDSVSELMTEWYWPNDDEGKKVPLSNFENGTREYIEAAVYSWRDKATNKIYWNARCASDRCGYQVKIDTHYHRLSLVTFNYPLREEHEKTHPIQLEWTWREQTELMTRLNCSIGDGIMGTDFHILFRCCNLCNRVGFRFRISMNSPLTLINANIAASLSCTTTIVTTTSDLSKTLLQNYNIEALNLIGDNVWTTNMDRGASANERPEVDFIGMFCIQDVKDLLRKLRAFFTDSESLDNVHVSSLHLLLCKYSRISTGIGCRLKFKLDMSHVIYGPQVGNGCMQLDFTRGGHHSTSAKPNQEIDVLLHQLLYLHRATIEITDSRGQDNRRGTAYYVKCMPGDVLECSITHAGTLLLMWLVDPIRYNNLTSGLATLIHEEGQTGIWKGFGPIFVGTRYKACSITYMNLAGKQKNSTDIALYPLEMTKVKILQAPRSCQQVVNFRNTVSHSTQCTPTLSMIQRVNHGYSIKEGIWLTSRGEPKKLPRLHRLE
ncbi:uncharacterized protein F5147DRAFT_658828 [Suillus discolor]|uniref:Uncharacterized protein n=1 Tax=Suillus discolor TaxID=1912936 RepID=A0A9P7ESC7_9AGAM|nr:uncharacterized protein F5147DRAFT_658828 [Suillus discolor]KAG2088021.1 hypothetical protein F5147DRAFT_658828 [Suillus discolor]